MKVHLLVAIYLGLSASLALASEKKVTPFFEVKDSNTAADYIAPDGLEVYLGAGIRPAKDIIHIGDADIARFEAPPGFVGKAVTHKTVDEIWYCLEGSGEIAVKEKADGEWEELALTPGVSVSLPLGSHFQVRNTGSHQLKILGVTTPHWPADPSEALEVERYWLNDNNHEKAKLLSKGFTLASKVPDETTPNGVSFSAVAEVNKAGDALVMRVEMPEGKIIKPSTSKEADEIWYCVSGKAKLVGEISPGASSQEIDITPGVSISLPAGSNYQVINEGGEPFSFLCIKTPGF